MRAQLTKEEQNLLGKYKSKDGKNYELSVQLVKRSVVFYFRCINSKLKSPEQYYIIDIDFIKRLIKFKSLIKI